MINQLKYSIFMFLLFFSIATQAMDYEKLCTDISYKFSTSEIKYGMDLGNLVNKQPKKTRLNSYSVAKGKIKEVFAQKWSDLHSKSPDANMRELIEFSFVMEEDASNYALDHPEEILLVQQKNAFDNCMYYIGRGIAKHDQELAERSQSPQISQSQSAQPTNNFYKDLMSIGLGIANSGTRQQPSEQTNSICIYDQWGNRGLCYSDIQQCILAARPSRGQCH